MTFYLDHIEALAETHMERSALSFYDEKNKQLHELSYLQLFEKSYLLSAFLIDEKPDAGCIAIIDSKNPSAYTVMLGSLFSGHSFSFIHPKHSYERIVTEVLALGAKTVWLPPELEELKAHLSQRIPDLFFLNLIEHRSAGTQRRKTTESLKERRAFTQLIYEDEGIYQRKNFTHQQIHLYLKKIKTILPIDSRDRLLNITQLSLENAVEELFWSLSNGASLICVNTHQLFMIPEILKLSQATLWSSTHALCDQILKARPYAVDYFKTIRTTVFYGQPLPPTLLQSWKDILPETNVFDFYELKINL